MKYVFLDCDPGHDDAMAIILAGHHPDLHLLGVSTACGNQTVDKTTINALKILSVSGLEHVEVVKGQAAPLMRPPKPCPEIHGTSGLDGTTFPVLTKKPIQGKKAIVYMNEVISQQTEPVHLICTGQLTNAALLLTVYPEIKEKLAQIVFMGGGVGVGNTSPAAEFNIECDPEAAKIVLESGVQIVMVPLEVTHTALCTPTIIERLHSLNTSFSSLIVDLLMFFQDAYKKVFRFQHPPLHDPCAVLYVARPDLFKTELMRVDIDTESRLCAGRTVCDIYHMSTLVKNVHVALHMNVDEFWNQMIQAVQKADTLSSMNK
ncbi:inosine-uridine-preferring nucleoside hydrolase [Acrasis kona]|uniref:Inosine-uridine-preferring nucleoside hydrolase n=1 Tax=Acrasis kona TaxID=1008807 RepID=A0AAW2YJI3_9EUKA